jgi:eukaryotic-like serine/threonine-protein kinase
MTALGAIKLGSFALGEPIGRGGMAEVWSGTHAGTGLDVAVKVVGAMRNPEQVASLHREIRAVARLDHAGIVGVFDYGTVSAEAARRSEGKLLEGSPWFAMERARKGTLRPQVALGWEPVQQVLLHLLDALAHAHARGVLHRDVKPNNVLLGTARATWSLSDFGMARQAEDQGEGSSGGTPAYVAPEQILRETHREGPPTDLYSLGCVAWRLVTDGPLFRRPDVMSLLQAHLNLPVPALVPAMVVPAGLEAWLRCLLAKDPAARFQHAADAAWALSGLGRPSVPAGQVEASFSREFPTLAIAYAPLHPDAVKPESDAVKVDPLPAPLPRTWRRAMAPPPPVQVTGAGLGLYGLRALPLVGREAERDAQTGPGSSSSRGRRVPGRAAWLDGSASEATRSVPPAGSVPCTARSGRLRMGWAPCWPAPSSARGSTTPR